MTQARDLADGKFDTDTLVVDAANNRVGIGQSSPESALHITSSSAILRLTSDTNSTSGVDFGDSDDTNIGRLLYDNSDNSMRFTTNTGERLRVLSGGGLTFNGDTAAANALDDYETGTYEPVLTPDSGSVTINSSHTKASYVKIGDMVHVQGHIVIQSDSSASGRILMTLPFNTADLDKTSARGAASIVVTGTAENVNTFAAFYGENSSQLDIRRSNGTGLSSTVGEALNGNDDIYFQATYRAS